MTVQSSCVSDLNSILRSQGIIMSKFASPRHSVVFSRSVTLNTGADGNPVLTFRMANVDGEAMVQPDFRMMVVMEQEQLPQESNESTTQAPVSRPMRSFLEHEGDVQGMWHGAHKCDVHNNGNHSSTPPVFYFCHVVDKDSPLRLDTDGMKIDLSCIKFISVTASGFCSQSEKQFIARHLYSSKDVVVGKQFEDCIVGRPHTSADPLGEKIVIDLSLFESTVPSPKGNVKRWLKIG